MCKKKGVSAMKRSARHLATIALIACMLAPPALAQEPPEEAPGIPAYGIARLKVLAGSIWVQPSDGSDWEEAPTNSPLTPRSRVSVPDGSEAELQFHGGQFVLLTEGTDLEVRDMEEGNTSFLLRAGEIRFDLPEDDFAPVSVGMPGGGRARFPEPGRYWITVTGDGSSRLVVRRGTSTVTHDGGQYRLSSGEEATIGREVVIGMFRGGSEPAPPPPELSDAERNASVPPVVSYELREDGEWVNAPAYGYVWRPRVAVGWSPYVYGRWMWVAPYGWTWVSYEPWGWYPYHSGYWVTDPLYGWVWAPYNSFVSVGIVFGSSHRHYYHRHFHYVPSNVRFVPEGREVRWVPLRPGERYRRPEVRRGDPRLSYWNRPLDNGRVFVRSGPGPHQRVWRDVTIVRSERQKAVRTAPSRGSRRDLRPVRPELTSRPPATGGAVGTRSTQPERRPANRRIEEGPGRSGRPQGGIPAPGSVRTSEPPRSAPAPRDVQRTAPRVETPREPAPRTTAPRVVTPRESAPARPEIRDVPETRGGGAVERAPATRAPERDSGGDRGRGGDGDRGGGRGDNSGGRGDDRGGDRGDRGGGGRSR
jgi:hypothetical protein